MTLIFAFVLFEMAVTAQDGQESQTPAGEYKGGDSSEKIAPAVSKPSNQSGQSATKQITFGAVNVSGSVRVRAENWGWFETANFDDSYTFGAAVIRISLWQQRRKFDWLIEGEFPVLSNLPERAVAPGPAGQLGLGASYYAANNQQDASAVLKQAFVRVKDVFGDKSSSFRAGRFEFSEGAETAPANTTLATLKRDHIAQRLIGPFSFSHVGRSFDAVQYVRNNRASNLTFAGGRAVEGVFQLRSLKELDVDFWYGAYTRPLPGKKVESELRLLALHYHDGRTALKTDNRNPVSRLADTRNIRINTLGGHYLAAMQVGGGTADFLAWTVGQFGRWGTLSHRAGALAVEAGFQPGGDIAATLKPWLRAGYFRSSGDADPADGKHTTFFQILPTPRIYARFPFYNLMNSEDVFAQLRLRPNPALSVRADVRHLRLSNKNDLWYSGGGAFQQRSFGYAGRPGGGSRSLGTLFDISADYAFKPNLTLSLYAAGVRGGQVQANIYPVGGRNPLARFIYFELVKRF